LWGLNSASEYINAANEQIVTIAQIETRQAVENAGEIAAVDGLGVWTRVFLRITV
jgi:2-keto-3-deoxy-L-rhamnonate aldolase RhmA